MTAQIPQNPICQRVWLAAFYLGGNHTQAVVAHTVSLYSWLVWNFVHRPDWPWNYILLPASASRVLGLKVGASKPGLKLNF